MLRWGMHLRRHFAVLCLVCGSIVLGGCAPIGRLLRPSVELSKSAVVLNVPYHRQTSEDLCGLAVAEILTDYYHVPLSAAGRKQLLQEANKTSGISGATLKAVLQEAGYFAAVFRGSLDHQVTGLYYNLDRRRPLVIMYLRKGSDLGHYVVVTGYDRAQGLLVVLDPATGRRVERKGRFLARWDGSGRFTLLAMPRSRGGP